MAGANTNEGVVITRDRPKAVDVWCEKRILCVLVCAGRVVRVEILCVLVCTGRVVREENLMCVCACWAYGARGESYVCLCVYVYVCKSLCEGCERPKAVDVWCEGESYVCLCVNVYVSVCESLCEGCVYFWGESVCAQTAILLPPCLLASTSHALLFKPLKCTFINIFYPKCVCVCV